MIAGTKSASWIPAAQRCLLKNTSVLGTANHTNCAAMRIITGATARSGARRDRRQSTTDAQARPRPSGQRYERTTSFRSVKELVEHLLRANAGRPAPMTYGDMALIVRINFPEAKTTAKSVASMAYHMRKEGRL